MADSKRAKISKREGALMARLSAKEQEVYEIQASARDLYRARRPVTDFARQVYTDPAINVEFQLLTAQLAEMENSLRLKEAELKELRTTADKADKEAASAPKGSKGPDKAPAQIPPGTGKGGGSRTDGESTAARASGLVARCQRLEQENEELASSADVAKVAQLRSEKAVAEAYAGELKTALEEAYDYIEQLEEEREVRSNKVYALEEELRSVMSRQQRYDQHQQHHQQPQQQHHQQGHQHEEDQQQPLHQHADHQQHADQQHADQQQADQQHPRQEHHTGQQEQQQQHGGDGEAVGRARGEGGGDGGGGRRDGDRGRGGTESQDRHPPGSYGHDAPPPPSPPADAATGETAAAVGDDMDDLYGDMGDMGDGFGGDLLPSGGGNEEEESRGSSGGSRTVVKDDPMQQDEPEPEQDRRREEAPRVSSTNTRARPTRRSTRNMR